jgi:hypothetical protein
VLCSWQPIPSPQAGGWAARVRQLLSALARARALKSRMRKASPAPPLPPRAELVWAGICECTTAVCSEHGEKMKVDLYVQYASIICNFTLLFLSSVRYQKLVSDHMNTCVNKKTNFGRVRGGEGLLRSCSPRRARASCLPSRQQQLQAAAATGSSHMTRHCLYGSSPHHTTHPSSPAEQVAKGKGEGGGERTVHRSVITS